MARQIGWICLTIGVLAFLTSESQAQVFRSGQILQSPLRALGHGNGPGYHRCNPGPDVSYYNPWSQKNSYLISQSPQFLARYGHELQPTPMQLLHSGQNPYGQPGGLYGHQHSGLQPTTPLSADFVPSKRDSDDDDDDNDAGSSALDSNKVEDRFEEDADDLDDGEFGGFDTLDDSDESQESPSDKNVDSSDDAARLLAPRGVFLPASHLGGN